MQRGFDSCFVEHEGQFLGVNLGADATSEHEWGIKKLRTAFGVDPKASRGISRLVINRVPSGNHGYLFDPEAMTMGFDAKAWGQYGLKQVARLDDGLACAWCDSAFLIHFDARHLDLMKQLDEAVHLHDVAFMFLGRDTIFSLRGLSLVIVSRLPESLLQKLEADDTHKEWVAATNEAIGIQGRLKAARCGYHSCYPTTLTPAWRQRLETADRSTAHDLIYWLNPEKQDRINYGYFTVEELDQWIAGTGPIPKKKEGIA